jgi:hypothetical protein
MASSFSGRVPLKDTVAMERCMFSTPGGGFGYREFAPLLKE